MQNPPLPPENPPQGDDYVKIADKVRTGEYFREARTMYDLGVHDSMSERYMYIFITFVAIVILLIALKAMQDLYPLESDIPIIFKTSNILEDIPHIQSLVNSKQDDPSEALLRLMVKNYVAVREEYDIDTFDRNSNGVKSQSTDEVYKQYQQFVDPRNAESPITLYQRHSKRKITVLSTRRLPGGMEVMFEARVQSKTDVKKSHWRANIAFQYSGIELDQKTDTVKPVKFVVTDYHSKRLQDVK